MFVSKHAINPYVWFLRPCAKYLYYVYIWFTFLLYLNFGINHIIIDNISLSMMKFSNNNENLIGFNAYYYDSTLTFISELEKFNFLDLI